MDKPSKKLSKSLTFATTTPLSAKKSKGNKSVDNVELGKIHSPGELKNTITPKSESKKLKKNKNVLDITADGENLEQRVTSTPYSGKKNMMSVKSIIKNSSAFIDELDTTDNDISMSRRKKRNKSVSFMLEEEVATKKPKADLCTTPSPKKGKSVSERSSTPMKKKNKKQKQVDSVETEKENIIQNINQSPTEILNVVNTPRNNVKQQSESENAITSEEPKNDAKKEQKKKKLKKVKKEVSNPNNTADSSSNENVEVAEKKPKKKRKRKPKTSVSETTTADGEPLKKTQKKDPKADVVEDLENLNIGDNPHTISDLLDEMTVVDKTKKNKGNNKKPQKKGKKGESDSAKTDKQDLEQIEEGKEKVKWKKRKWNKDKKAEEEERLTNSVIVENLPLKIVLRYRKLLAEHFGTFGAIKKIGVGEVYPTEEPKPVFTTTVYFDSDEAATKALEEDGKKIEGSRIRVKRPLPATDTTLVVRSYADLTEQAVGTVFNGAGKIRRIQQLIKGKNTMNTVFVEFDGPESVERAIKMAADAKIGAKKIYVAKFENRGAKKAKNNSESDNKKEPEQSKNAADSSSDSDEE